MVVTEVDSMLDRAEWSMSFLASIQFQAPLYAHHKARTAESLQKEVVESEAVKRVIEKAAHKTADRHEHKEEDLEQRARNIITRMGHNMSPRTLNMMAVCLRKIILNLFSCLKVNVKQLHQLRQDMRHSPVVFVPTHRSYMDFLLLSFVLHCAGLPVPAIAAGEDFLGMVGISHLLRWSGAFFIRRSFFDDDLYKTIFFEYVQRLLSNGVPLEFFVEGTRSRSGKALCPMYGMLGTSSEPFFDNRVADISYIPVSITFERQLEREMYPVELLGTPKPKESLSGLINARSVFKRDYGAVHVIFGDSISLREHSKGIVSRSKAGNLESGQAESSVAQSKRRSIKALGHKIIREHRTLSVVTMTTIVAAVIPRLPREFLFDDLETFAKPFYLEVIRRGGSVDMRGNEFEENIRQGLAMMHPHVIEIYDDEGTTQKFRRCDEAESTLVFANYRNQLSHLFVADSLIIIAAIGATGKSNDKIHEYYCFLHKLMTDEFVLSETPLSITDVGKRLKVLLHGMEHVEKFLDSRDPVMQMLPWFVWPILDCYKVVVSSLIHRKELFMMDKEQFIPMKVFMRLCGSHASELLCEGRCCSNEVRSLDSMKIAVKWIRRCGPGGIVAAKNKVINEWSSKQSVAMLALLDMINKFSGPAIIGHEFDTIPKSRL